MALELDMVCCCGEGGCVCVYPRLCFARSAVDCDDFNFGGELTRIVGAPAT